LKFRKGLSDNGIGENLTISTEFDFVLPRGYIDGDGTVHREGKMRLATAFDEIAPMNDPRVQTNSGYLINILLTRVVVQLGTLPMINPKVIEGLFLADLAYLQAFYRRINGNGGQRMQVACPHCKNEFEFEINPDEE
jgi:hypothetical protein